LVNTFARPIVGRSLTDVSVLNLASRRASVPADFITVIACEREEFPVPADILAGILHELMVLLANTSPTYELEFVGSVADEASFHSSGFDHGSAACNRCAELPCEFPLEANAHLIDRRRIELCRIAGNAWRVGKIGIDARATDHR